MKTHGKQLLSALLTLAMLLSLFVVPAGAVTLPEGKTWTLADGDWTSISSNGTSTHEWDGLKFDTTNGGQVKAPGSWTQFNEGAIVKVPVADCSGNEYHAVVTIKVYAKGTFTVAGKTNTVANGEESFKCVGTEDTDGNHYVTITALAGSSDYLSTIAVSYAEGPLPQDPELTLDKDSVVVKENGTVTITPTVANVTDPEVTATPAESTVAAATVGDDNVITITGTTAGKTKVTVGVTGTDCSAEVTVRVVAADPGKIDAANPPDITYKGTSGDAQADKVFGTSGVEWPINIGTDNGEGPHGANPVIKIHMPDGKQGDIVVSNCGYSSGHLVTMEASSGTVTSVNNDTAEGSNYGKTWTVAGAKGTTALTFSGNNVYIHSLKVTNITDADPEPEGPTIAADEVEAGTINFITLAASATTTEGEGNDARGPVPETKGLTVSADAVLQTASTSHGLTAKANGATMALKLAAPAAVTLVECQYGANKITGVTAGGEAVDVPERWAMSSGSDKEIVFENMPKGDFVLTLGAGAFIHSVKVDYGTDQAPQMQLSGTVANLELGSAESATTTITAMTRFTDGAVKAESKDTGVVTTSVNGNEVTLTAAGEGQTTVDITVEGTELKQTVNVDVAAAGAVFVEGKLYNFAASGITADTIAAIRGLSVSGDFVYGNSHGIQNVVGSTITLKLEKRANITVVGCTFGTGKNLEIASTSGTVTKELGAWNTNETDVPKFVVEEAEGETVLTLTGTSTWIHSIEVTYLPDPVPVAERRVQVWDFGGKVETNAGLYTNNITPDTLKNAKLASGDPTIVAGVIKTAQNTSDGTEFGNVVFAAGNNDKFFSNVAELAELAGGNAGDTHAHDFGDGYTSAGGFITNGGGNASRRHVTVKAVQAGELVTAYLSNNQSDTTFEVEGFADIPAVTVKSREFGVMSFVAPKTGNYKIWANGGKPGFLRVTVTPTVKVTGSITLPAAFDATDWVLRFVDPATKAVTVAKVDKTAKTYTVELAPGRTYNAALSGAPGWGVNAETKELELTTDKITTGVTHDLTVDVRPQFTYSGTITGFAEGYDTSKLVVTMVPDEDSVATVSAEEIDLTLDGNGFSAYLDCDVTYTVTLKGVNDYQVKSPESVFSAKENLADQTITVEAKSLQAVSGKLLELDVDDQFAPLYADSAYAALSATPTALVFENVEDGYTYPATVKDGGYTAELRAGSYLAKATVEGYATQTHVVVADKAVERDLLFVSTATPAGVDYAADVYVGDATKTPNFKTVTGALAYIGRMTRTDAQRVTVHIAPGTYREQIDVNVKNVTFVNDAPNQTVKLTWYYGIGYKYYSAKFVSSTECWYDPQLAFDRYEKADYDVSRWGATVRVRAPGFRAENITFENSFNYYVTDEEVYDGVVYNGKETIRFARDPGADVTSKAATERAAALWVDTNSGRGDMTEFKSCKFLSSQDTLGTGKRMYFKDCYIEGMTDFICGPGDVVFDTCTLNWKGYSETETAGYLTAPQTAASEKGYLFRNCYVSGNTKLMLKGGALGRTWGAENTKCLYLNTTLQSADMLTEPTWIEMQGFDPANSSTLLEWGTQLEDGTKVDLSARQLQNTVLKAAPAVDVKTDYFQDWIPAYYVEEADSVAIEGAVSIVDNGDINIPYPGHTLTVVYSLGQANDANDVSKIQWYAVKDGAETLVKSSFANADKTYKIQTADVGAQIKVVVTPATMSGKTGEAKSATVEAKVQEGYDDPTGSTDPELGDGVNIFLAGDSTVKHYGATGMHQSGKIGKEGSWGEYLQAYFNDKVNVANYANGGRSTRNFINEGKLDSIAKKIGAGDYLFIQFGHNDCADGASYIEDRYVPLGTPDANGVYPVTPGVKSATPDALQKQYGTQWYAWDCGGTYKWFLQQYIDVAKNAGATPVLITPVARMYYNADGTIRAHHDDSKTENNAYCTAVKQLAQEQNVLLLDGYALTEKMYVDAYKAAGNDTYGQQVMAEGDKTHSNKLGGMIEAALIAQAVQGMELNISKAVQAPGAITGKTESDATAFTVDAQGKFTAYDMLKDYAETAPYWMGEGQKLIDAIAAKAKELNGGSTTDPTDPSQPPVDPSQPPVDPSDPPKPADKATLTEAIAAAQKKADDIYTVSDDTKTSDVNRGTKFVTESDKAALTAAIAAAKAVADKADATDQEIAKAVADLKTAVETFDKAVKTGTKGSGGGSTSRPSGSSTNAGTTSTVKNPDGSVATIKKAANGDKTITVKDKNGEVVAEVTLPATISTAKTKFVDVPDEHWAAKSINNMAALGMVKGVTEDTFDMTSPMTRGAIATILFRLSNGKEGKSVTFADVAKDAWYADAVGWAAGAKLITGYDETTFGPDDTITRQQLAVMIARYARLLGLDTTADTGALNAFTDGSSTDTWATDAMAWCVKVGVMNGRGNGTLDPKTNVTRAEAAAMLDRMIGLLK